MDHREMMRLWHQPTFRGGPWEPERDRAHSASGVHDAEKAGRTFVHPPGRYGNPPWLGTLASTHAHPRPSKELTPAKWVQWGQSRIQITSGPFQAWLGCWSVEGLGTHSMLAGAGRCG